MYDQIKELARDQVADLLEDSNLPAKDEEIARIQAAYGSMAPSIVKDQRPFLDLTDEKYNALKAKILAHWTEILEIAAQVPSAQEITRSLQAVSGPTSVSELGLTAEEQAKAEQYGHYLRQRFTIRKLVRVLGLA